MEWLGKGGYWRGILISASLFASLFLTHILLAANGYMALFKIVAIVITIQLIAVGPTIILFGQIDNLKVKIVALKIGLVIAIPLNIGLGWAYAGMTISIAWMAAFPALTTVLHLIAIQRTKAL
jgi:hypothetical protein